MPSWKSTIEVIPSLFQMFVSVSRLVLIFTLEVELSSSPVPLLRPLPGTVAETLSYSVKTCGRGGHQGERIASLSVLDVPVSCDIPSAYCPGHHGSFPYIPTVSWVCKFRTSPTGQRGKVPAIAIRFLLKCLTPSPVRTMLLYPVCGR